MERFVIMDKSDKYYCMKSGSFYFGHETDENVLLMNRVTAKNYLASMEKSLRSIAQPVIVPVTCMVTVSDVSAARVSPITTEAEFTPVTATELAGVAGTDWGCLDYIHDKHIISDELYSLLVEFIRVCEQYRDLTLTVKKARSQHDLEINDIYHYIELGNLDGVGLCKAAKLLKVTLSKRRNAKNDQLFLAVLPMLVDPASGNTVSVILDSLKVYCQRIDERKYTERTDILNSLSGKTAANC